MGRVHLVQMGTERSTILPVFIIRSVSSRPWWNSAPLELQLRWQCNACAPQSVAQSQRLTVCMSLHACISNVRMLTVSTCSLAPRYQAPRPAAYWTPPLLRRRMRPSSRPRSSRSSPVPQSRALRCRVGPCTAGNLAPRRGCRQLRLPPSSRRRVRCSPSHRHSRSPHKRRPSSSSSCSSSRAKLSWQQRRRQPRQPRRRSRRHWSSCSLCRPWWTCPKSCRRPAARRLHDCCTRWEVQNLASQWAVVKPMTQCS